MTVTFNSVVLADGENRTCKVASGLVPSGEQGVEVLEFLRAEWALPVARGNRVLTLPLIIEIPPFASFGAALVGGLTYFANLPAEGPLVIAEGANQVTFTDAVCARCKVVDSIEGLSHAVALQFICGAPDFITLSPLAQMDIRNKGNLYAITQLTGGTATDLDGQTTTDVTVGFQCEVFVPVGGLNQLCTFRLKAGTDATNTDPDAGPIIVRPTDFNAGTNAKIWMRLDA